MNEKITIITAFFDIGREKFSILPRSSQRYLEYFEFWAKLDNQLIVYTDSIIASEVLKIREAYGRKEKTEIVIIEDCFSIEPEIYEKMQEISRNFYFNKFRIISDAISNNASYDYIMLLKYWCLQDAVKRFSIKNTCAWMDFGFNHGGKVYSNTLEFNFSWEHNFKEKIYLWHLEDDIDKKPIFESIRRLSTSIMGCLLVLPSKDAKKLWELVKEAMEQLLAVGFIDDDQLLLLMAYRKEPDSFILEKSNWFLPLKEHGAKHLTTVPLEKKTITIVTKIKQAKKLIKYLVQVTESCIKG